MSQYLHFRNNPGLFSTVLVVCVVCILFFPVTRSSGAEFSPAGTVAGGNFCAGSEIGSIMAGLNLGATGQTDDGAMGLLLNLLGYPGNEGQADNYTLMTGRLYEMDNALVASASLLTDK